MTTTTQTKTAQMILPRTIGTHDGTFHADEVTSCALLIYYGAADRNSIKRTRDPLLLDQCEFVCDVGNVYNIAAKRFDHHQNEYTGPLSSAGMVVRYLHDQGIISEGEFILLTHTLIDGVDAHDNGHDPQIPGVCTFSHIISNFLPVNYEATAEELLEAFYQALDFVIGHIKRLIERYRYTQSARQIVEMTMKAYQEILVFDQPTPWLDLFFELGGISHPAQFIIMPTGKNWKLRGIPPSLHDKMKVRKSLPQNWAGLQDRELAKVSGIHDAVFCHKARFISVWKTKEAAIEAAKYSLKQL